MAPVGINRLWREFLKALKEEGLAVIGDPTKMKVELYDEYLDDFSILEIEAEEFVNLFIEEMLSEPMRISDGCAESKAVF